MFKTIVIGFHVYVNLDIFLFLHSVIILIELFGQFMVIHNNMVVFREDTLNIIYQTYNSSAIECCYLITLQIVS